MVVIRSGMNREDALRLNRSAFRRLLWLVLLVSAVLIVFGLASLMGEARDVVGACVFFVMAGIFPFAAYFLSMAMAKRNIRTNTSIDNRTKQIFTFTEDTVTIEQTGPHMRSINEFDWTMFYKVVEERDYFFLYISNMQSLIANKNDVTEGSIEELQQMLERRLGIRYKRKKTGMNA